MGAGHYHCSRIRRSLVDSKQGLSGENLVTRYDNLQRSGGAGGFPSVDEMF